MTDRDKKTYLDMVDKLFYSDGKLTHDGRGYLAATFYSVDKLIEQNEVFKRTLREIVKSR